MARTAKGDNSRKATGLEAWVLFPGVDNVEGRILNHNKNGVEFEYFRYGSRYRQFFPAKKIVACLGSPGSKECMLWFRTDTKGLWDKGKRDRPVPITEPEVYGDNLIKSSSPDFSLILLSPEFTTIIGKTTGETGRGRGRKPKPGKEDEVKEKRDPRERSGKRKKDQGEKKAGDWD